MEEFIQVRVDKGLKQELLKQAKRSGQTLSDYVRTALINRLKIDMNEVFKLFLLIYKRLLKLHLETVSGQSLLLKTIVHRDIMPKKALEQRVKAFHKRWEDLVDETEYLLHKIDQFAEMLGGK